jgi:hypothetical protein
VSTLHKTIGRLIDYNWWLPLLAVAGVLVSGLIGSQASVLLPELVDRELLVLLALLAGFGMLVVCIVAFDAVVLLLFCISALVRIEPAPFDLLAMVLLAIGVIARHLSLDALKGASAFHLAIGIFLALNLLPFVWIDQVGHGLRYTAITVYLIFFAYFVRMYLVSERRMRIALAGYLVAALLSVILVLLDFLGLAPPETFVVETRAVAYFKDANVYGPFLVLAIVWLVDEAWFPHFWRGWLGLKVALVALLTAGLFLSFSRAAWGHLVVALGLYLLFNLRSFSLKQIIGLALALIAGAGVILLLVWQLGLLDFLLWRASPLQSYDSERFGTQAEGLYLGMTNLFGVGPDMIFGVHSLYVKTFAEYGIFGFLALMTALFGLTGALIRRAVHADSRVYGLSARVTAACMVGVMLNSFVIDTLHWRYFWFVVGLGWVIVAAGRSSKPPLQANETTL